MSESIAIICRTAGKVCGVGQHAQFLADELGADLVASARELEGRYDCALIEHEIGLYTSFLDHPLLTRVPLAGDCMERVDITSGRPRLRAELATARAHARRVVVEAHTVKPGSPQNEILATADAVIVHHPSNLLEFPNAVHIPVFVPRLGALIRLPSGRVKVATLGLASPGKRVEWLASLLNSIGIPLAARLSLSESSARSHRKSVAYIRKLQRSLGPENEVEVTFSEPGDLPRRMADITHFIFAAHNERTYGSGAIRLGIALGRPVLAVFDERPGRAPLLGSLNVVPAQVTPELLEGTRRALDPTAHPHFIANLAESYRKALLGRGLEGRKRVARGHRVCTAPRAGAFSPTAGARSSSSVAVEAARVPIGERQGVRST